MIAELAVVDAFQLEILKVQRPHRAQHIPAVDALSRRRHGISLAVEHHVVCYVVMVRVVRDVEFPYRLACLAVFAHFPQVDAHLAFRFRGGEGVEQVASLIFVIIRSQLVVSPIELGEREVVDGVHLMVVRSDILFVFGRIELELEVAIVAAEVNIEIPICSATLHKLRSVERISGHYKLRLRIVIRCHLVVCRLFEICYRQAVVMVVAGRVDVLHHDGVGGLLFDREVPRLPVVARARVWRRCVIYRHSHKRSGCELVIALSRRGVDVVEFSVDNLEPDVFVLVCRISCIESVGEHVVSHLAVHLCRVAFPVAGAECAVAEVHLRFQLRESDAHRVQIHRNLIVARLLFGEHPFVVVYTIKFHDVVLRGSFHKMVLVPVSVAGHELELIGSVARYLAVSGIFKAVRRLLERYGFGQVPNGFGGASYHIQFVVGRCRLVHIDFHIVQVEGDVVVACLLHGELVVGVG